MADTTAMRIHRVLKRSEELKREAKKLGYLPGPYRQPNDVHLALLYAMAKSAHKLACRARLLPAEEAQEKLLDAEQFLEYAEEDLRDIQQNNSPHASILPKAR